MQGRLFQLRLRGDVGYQHEVLKAPVSCKPEIEGGMRGQGMFEVWEDVRGLFAMNNAGEETRGY